eukprot:m.165784 g.165784  ORF g.165784 m.165784 type:complete len:80 (-) comp16605_c0_seq1:1824-2063(-)
MDIDICLTTFTSEDMGYKAQTTASTNTLSHSHTRTLTHSHIHTHDQGGSSKAKDHHAIKTPISTHIAERPTLPIRERVA